MGYKQYPNYGEGNQFTRARADHLTRNGRKNLKMPVRCAWLANATRKNAAAIMILHIISKLGFSKKFRYPGLVSIGSLYYPGLDYFNFAAKYQNILRINLMKLTTSTIFEALLKSSHEKGLKTLGCMGLFRRIRIRPIRLTPVWVYNNQLIYGC